MFNPIIRGWITYYCRYYKSALYPTLRYLNRCLARWAMAKYKRLKRHRRRADDWIRRTFLRIQRSSPIGLCCAARRLDDKSRMSGDAHVRIRERLGVKFPRATRPIIGFEHQQDAERFLADLSARLAEFGLGLHPDKTRLIEFGRNAIANHRSRGLGKPKTFDFLGFTHYCATRRSGSGFVLGRTPIRSRIQTKLREIKEQLRATPPMSAPAITAFRHHLIERWLRAVRRRGQKHRLPWRWMKLIANRYLPYPRILHPWPEQRFLVTHPR